MPETDRTRAESDLKFLHLTISDINNHGKHHQTLITDLPGEIFRSACDSIDNCRRLTVLNRADRLALLLDGDRLSHPESRHEEIQSGQSLLRSMLDSGMLDPNLCVDVLITKYDKLIAGDGSSRFEEVIEGLVSDYSRLFESRIKTINYARVAARPEDGSTLPLGYGLGDIFRSWVYSRRPLVTIRSTADIPISARQYDHYAYIQK